MRKITEKAGQAFNNGYRFKKSNTEVRIENDGSVYMYLFGRAIAKKENGEIFICNGNYRATVTTSDRLSVLVPVRKRQGQLIVKEKVVLEEKWLNINQI
jgi:hypothetical protein